MSAIPWISNRDDGTGSLAAASAIRYINPGVASSLFLTTEAPAQRTIRTAGVWSKLWARIITNGVTATSTFRSRVNGADGAQVVSVGSGATGEFRDSTNTDTIAAGDEINHSFLVGATGSTIIYDLLGTVYAATADSMTLLNSTDGNSSTLNNVTRYFPVAGSSVTTDSTTTQTEANVQHTVRAAGTYKNYFTNVRTNAKGGTSTWRFRKNGANGNGVISIGTGVTGILEDTSNTDAVVAGDLANYSITYYADAGAFQCWTTGSAEFISTAGQGVLLASVTTAAVLTVAAASTNYGSTGNIQHVSTTELDFRTELQVAGTLSKLNGYVISNTIVGTSTIRTRINGAQGNQVLSWGTAETGWKEDSSGTDTLAATDEFCLEYVGGAAGTALLFNNVALVFTAAVMVASRNLFANQSVNRAATY